MTDVDWRKEYEKAWASARERGDALYQFRYPISPTTLRAVADEIDCSGHFCDDLGPMDWETGISECRKAEDAGIGCRAAVADELRQFAAALETAGAVRTTDGLGAYRSFPPSILAHMRHGWRQVRRFFSDAVGFQ